MRRRKFGIANHEDDSAHGNRPWVFFMVDCFFLITEFFVLTFQFKVEESALPRTLPPGNHPGPTPYKPDRETIHVHVSSTSGYSCENTPMTFAGVEDRLAAAARLDKNRFSVQVSYDGNAQWRDVMAVFNTCTKVKIAECGLKPLHDADSH